MSGRTNLVMQAPLSTGGQKVPQRRDSAAVLVVTTLTGASIAALQPAAAWAQLFGDKLYVLYLMGHNRRSNMLFPQRHLAEVFEHHLAIEVLQNKAQQWVKNMTGQWLPIEQILVAEGSASEQVMAAAMKIDAELIVMGLPRAGESGPRDGLTGRQISRIVSRSHKPVLVARTNAAATQVLAATDFTDPAFPALRYARSIADRVGAELTFLHHVYPSYASFTALPFAAPFPRWPRDVICLKTHDARQRINRLAAHFGGGIETVVTEGDGTASQILAEAAVRHADIIVVGAHDTGVLQRWLHRQVGVDIIEQATASVLVVPIDLQ